MPWERHRTDPFFREEETALNKHLARRAAPALRLTPLAALIGAGLALPALAQNAPAAESDVVGLDRIVVTGTASAGSKLRQSVSISTLEADDIAKQAPTSAAEILRSIPGVRSESSGGEGNANITVRGVPISAGGARYVQFQEDGLPILMFGDIAFGTSDQFLRADYSLSHLEMVRGGSASTLATNSPGGLVNFISKTGEDPGGAAGITLGLVGGRQTRLDFDLGGKLGEKLRFHIGGFHRVGEGDRKTGYNSANGGQVKANITQEFDAGYVRVNLKALDDRTPTFLPVPTYLENGEIRQVPGIDPRTAWFIGPGLTRDPVLGADGGTVVTNPHDGLRVKSMAIGLEAEFKLGDGWKLSEKFRKASNSGRFIGLFPSDNGGASAGNTPGTFTGVLFNTSIDSLDNTVNDLKISKTFGGNLTLSAGLFTSVQDVALTWFWNRYTVDMRNSGAGAQFLGAGWDTFGGCCVRNFDVQYTTTAPYAALNWDLGGLSLDASVRRDQQRASGFAIQDDPVAQAWDPGTQQLVDYKVSHTSYSVGANYQFSKDLAAFARTSSGVSFSADRLLYGNPLDGSVPVAKNEVDQTEGGIKWRSGGFSLFGTLFHARTSESNYEATTQRFTANKYRANGAELEMGWRAGGLRVAGGLTLTKAEITAANDAAVVGKTPRRQADWVFQLSPSYAFGPVELGAAIIGTGDSWGDDANTIRMEGYTVINAFANWQVSERASISLSVNNLNNTVGWTEVEGDGHAARSINGRSAKLALKYSF